MHFFLSPKRYYEKEPVGVPVQLVRDYTVRVLREGRTVGEITVRDNHQRLNVVDLPAAAEADCVEIRFTATNGAPDVRVFEVRVY